MPRPTPEPYALAIRALRAESGITEDEARAVLRAAPGSVTVLAERGAAAWIDEQVAAEEAAYAASPEGRQEQARAVIAAEQEQADRLAEGKALLRAQHGFSEEDVDKLDAATIFRATGVAEPPAKQPASSMNSIIPKPEQASAAELALLEAQEAAHAAAHAAERSQ
ncbi:MAG: hypothetical protein ACRDYB_17310 [Acidimicrobiales bacterium]